VVINIKRHMTFVKAVCVHNDYAATQNMIVKFKVFMVVKIHIVDFWVMTPCNLLLEGMGGGRVCVFEEHSSIL
jgi:hypothetical protein